MNSRRRLIGDRSAGRHRHSGGRVGGHGHNHARQRVAVKGVARRHVVDDESGCVGLRRCSRDSDRGMEARYRWMAVGVGEQKTKTETADSARIRRGNDERKQCSGGTPHGPHRAVRGERRTGTGGARRTRSRERQTRHFARTRSGDRHHMRAAGCSASRHHRPGHRSSDRGTTAGVRVRRRNTEVPVVRVRRIAHVLPAVLV